MTEAKSWNVCYPKPYEINGAERTRWVTLGRATETKRGIVIRLDAVPIGFDGRLMLFVRLPEDEHERPRGVSRSDEAFAKQDLNEDIPF